MGEGLGVRGADLESDRAIALWPSNRPRHNKGIMADTLPIDAVLPDLIASLGARGMAVLEAPPGAGKTTRVPLALLSSGLVPGRIVMLEPRRLAARAAAERMAETLGEPVGRPSATACGARRGSVPPRGSRW